MFSLAKQVCLVAEFVVRNLDTFRRVIAFAITLSALCGSLEAGDQKLIKITTQKKEGVTQFFVENLQQADVTVTIDLELKNLDSTAPVPFTATVSAQEKLAAFTLSPAEPKDDSSWSYTYYATWGSLSVKHDDSA